HRWKGRANSRPTPGATYLQIPPTTQTPSICGRTLSSLEKPTAFPTGARTPSSSATESNDAKFNHHHDADRQTPRTCPPVECGLVGTHLDAPDRCPAVCLRGWPVGRLRSQEFSSRSTPS